MAGFPPQGNKADVSDLATIDTNVDTLLTRLSADRAGYLDNLSAGAVALNSNLATVLTRLSATRAGYLEQLDFNLQEAIAAIPTTAMRGTDGAALASSWTAALATALGNYNATRAGYLDHLNRDRPDMIFPSAPAAIVVIPGTGADLNFPNVTVEDLPSGLSIARADYVLIIGALLDTSGSENQIKTGTTDGIYVQANGGDWSSGLLALTFTALGLQVDGNAYRGGTVIFGAIDISATVTGNGTYNFRSDESVKSKGVEATAGTIELLDVTSIIRIWFN